MVNKILLAGLPEENADLLQDLMISTTLSYDDVVEAMTPVLLISSCLYIRGKARIDDRGDRARYSQV